jgi:predicted MFS family arabinose efflux permease
VHLLCVALIADAPGAAGAGRLDLAGAATITTSLMLAVYAVVDGNVAGWASAQTVVLLGAALVLFVVFLVIEARVAAPLMPLGLFRLRNVAVANVAGVLWAAAMFAWFFICALYMQRVLGYTPLQVGLGFLPANIVMALLSLGFSAKIVMRFGTRGPLAFGLLLAAAGLALFAHAPVQGVFIRDILPGMLLLGLGAGVALNPMLLAAMSDVGERDSGLASGVVNTAFMMGGALGLAVLASVAAARTQAALGGGMTAAAADTAGYQLALLLGAFCAVVAALVGAVFMRVSPPPAATESAGNTSAQTSGP